MKNLLQKGLIPGMLLLCGNVFGQAIELPKESQDRKIQDTHLRFVLNAVNTSLNYGEANSELSDYKKSNRGIQAGVSFQAGITSKVSLLSEFYFITKGGQLKSNNPLTVSKSSLRFYTLEFPVLARLHFGRFHINAGPSLAYNLSGRRKMEGSYTDLSFDNSGEGFKRFDAGIQMGGGYWFKIKQRNVVLDIRYSNGLTNVSRGQEVYNRYLNISLQCFTPWKRNPLGRNKNS